jgi:hypothetical protein
MNLALWSKLSVQSLTGLGRLLLLLTFRFNDTLGVRLLGHLEAFVSDPTAQLGKVCGARRGALLDEKLR